MKTVYTTQFKSYQKQFNSGNVAHTTNMRDHKRQVQ